MWKYLKPCGLYKYTNAAWELFPHYISYLKRRINKITQEYVFQKLQWGILGETILVCDLKNNCLNFEIFRYMNLGNFQET